MKFLKNNKKDNSLIIDKKTTFKRKTLIYENAHIEIHNVLWLRDCSVVFKRCTFYFYKYASSIIGTGSTNIKFEECIFISDESNYKGKIVSFKEELKTNKGLWNFLGSDTDRYSLTTILFVKMNLTFALAEKFNPVEYNKCRFIGVTFLELVNAKISNTVFDGCHIDINTTSVHNCTFKGGAPYLFIDKKGKLTDSVFKDISISAFIDSIPSFITVSNGVKIKGCVFKNLSMNKEHIIQSTDNNYKITRCKFI